MAYAQWNPATYYLPNDIVDYEGLLYIATGLQPNLNQTPDPAGTTYWGVNGGGGSGSAGVLSVTSNPTGGGIVISGSPANPVVAAYQWPFLQMSSKTNNVTLPSTVASGQPGAVNAIDQAAPVKIFTSTFDAPVTGSAYSNALFTLSFTNIDLSVGTAVQQFYNIQIFPWIGSSPPSLGTSNNYAQCSSPIQFNQIETNAIQEYPVIQPQAFTVTLNPQGQLFQSVDWYAVNLQPGQLVGYLLDPNGSTPSIHWSGFAWNTTGTTAG
jgi:hypothetical protein